ncbi:hypothetical protein N8149_00195 [Gammaproteobacteria bacterium]|nr:hypothetical protein [Gammaproteobacteria bacterium]
MKKLLLLTFFITCMGEASERSINEIWCIDQGGVTEHRTSYGTYVDCLTKDLAIEVEYDYNWKESIGQALHYAEATNRSAGILLINRSKSRVNYLEQLRAVIDKYDLPIKVFVTNQ